MHCCHCVNCQRQTGSAFVINLLIETDRVELLAGDPQPVSVHPHGTKKQRIWRCPTCQIAVFSQYTSEKVRFVRGGTLDDPASVVPDVHIYTGRRPWVTLQESVPAFNTYYDTKKLWPAVSPSASKRSGDSGRQSETDRLVEPRGSALTVAITMHLIGSPPSVNDIVPVMPSNDGRYDQVLGDR